MIFINYYDEIKNKLIDNEIYNRVKDYSKERNKVITYFEVGKLLDEAGKHYGENIIKEYSLKLINEVGKKFNERTLRRIRQYYRVFCNKKWSPMATKLSWSHYTELLSIKDERKLNYYINILDLETGKITYMIMDELMVVRYKGMNDYSILAQGKYIDQCYLVTINVNEGN